MGTSGVYGGSGSGAWRAARVAVAVMPVEAPPTAGTSPHGDPEFDAALSNAAAAIADAIVGEEPLVVGPPTNYPVQNLLPHARGTGGGGGGGGLGRTRGASTAGGRTGGSSRRNMHTGVRRGGLALGAAYALRSRDRAGLAALGLDLTALEVLPAAGRVARILDAVLGPATHPDEQVLREAAAEQVKAIVMGEAPPTVADAVRDIRGDLRLEDGIGGAARAVSRWIASG